MTHTGSPKRQRTFGGQMGVLHETGSSLFAQQTIKVCSTCSLLANGNDHPTSPALGICVRGGVREDERQVWTRYFFPLGSCYGTEGKTRAREQRKGVTRNIYRRTKWLEGRGLGPDERLRLGGSCWSRDEIGQQC